MIPPASLTSATATSAAHEISRPQRLTKPVRGGIRPRRTGSPVAFDVGVSAVEGEDEPDSSVSLPQAARTVPAATALAPTATERPRNIGD